MSWHDYRMSTTLTLDPAGGLFVPAALLERAHLSQGNRVSVDVETDRLIVKPAAPSAGQETAQAKLMRKGRIEVFTGIQGTFDAVTAVEQMRADREEQLLAHRNER